MKAIFIMVFCALFVQSFGLNKNTLAYAEHFTCPQSDTKYQESADVMPEIAGGMEALVKAIQYPEDAKKDKIEGKVFVDVFINEKGEVDKAEVKEGADPRLDKAAIEAVKKIRFVPAKDKGKNVKMKIVIPIQFKLG